MSVKNPIIFRRRQGYRKPIFGIGILAIVIFSVFNLRTLQTLTDFTKDSSQNLLQYETAGTFSLRRLVDDQNLAGAGVSGLTDVSNLSDVIGGGNNVSRANCTPNSVSEFPADVFTLEQKQQGAIIVHLLVALYMFGALGIVCDDYFVSSLECISDAMNLTPDVAGATFMAAGSSAPELFTALIGVFIAKSDLGVGTIVGSAVFNILCIVAICGIFACKVIKLTWWPIVRDTVYYMFSVIALVIVMLDGKVLWYEGLVLVLMYLIYVLVMYFNKKLEKLSAKLSKIRNKKEKVELEATPLKEENSQTSNGNGVNKSSPKSNGKLEIGHSDSDKTVNNQTTDIIHSNKALLDYETNKTDLVPAESEYHEKYSVEIIPSESDEENDTKSEKGTKTFSRAGSRIDMAAVEESEEFESPFKVPEKKLSRIYWVVMLPMSCLLVMTVPDCRRGGCWRRLFAVTFIMSIVWIGVFSYLMVWMVVIVGHTFGIPDTVMGLTLLAAGTSVPDAMAGLFVAKKGFGDMAVCNAVGSNVFDILICLGLPWLLRTTLVAGGDVIPINSSGLIYSALTLLTTIVILLIVLTICKWTLTVKSGLVFLFLYVAVIGFSCLYELNVFGELNPPSC